MFAGPGGHIAVIADMASPEAVKKAEKRAEAEREQEEEGRGGLFKIFR